jgi:uncharacterized protein YecE (DUF72 family)
MVPVLHVGCPMWAHREWVGRFLPAGTAHGAELAAYSRYVNAVEGNTTFYASPPAATVERWLERVHPGFSFVFKVPRVITHDKRLRDIDADVAAFVELMSPLHGRIGGLTLQLPASFAPVDLGVLDGVLGSLPSGWRWSVEVRHLGFFQPPGRAALDRVLTRHGAERVLLDSRALFSQPPRSEAGREAWEKKPRVPALTDALTDRPIVRFIGSDDPERTSTGLQEWLPIIEMWLGEGRTPTLFVHTPDNVDSPGLARTFHAEMALLVEGLQPLPDALPLLQAEQGSLF